MVVMMATVPTSSLSVTEHLCLYLSLLSPCTPQRGFLSPLPAVLPSQSSGTLRAFSSAQPLAQGDPISPTSAQLHKESLRMTFILNSSGILLCFRTLTFHSSVHHPLRGSLHPARFLFCSACGDSSTQSILGHPWEHFTEEPALYSSQNSPGNVYQTLFKLFHLLSYEMQFEIRKSEATAT